MHIGRSAPPASMLPASSRGSEFPLRCRPARPPTGPSRRRRTFRKGAHGGSPTRQGPGARPQTRAPPTPCAPPVPPGTRP
eukprot:15441367-Alexandrium_andersonii.AAC.1